MSLAFLADENVEAQIVERLASLGHATVHASEAFAGATDAELLKFGSHAGQVLITNDKDFGALVFRKHYRSTGVILVRLPGQPPTEKARLVAQAVEHYGERLLGAFVVIGPRMMRLRRVPD